MAVCSASRESVGVTMGKQKLLNYVVNSHVRNELEINELLRLIHLLPDDPELNENQQIVLEWLKNNAEWGTPTGLIHELTKRNSMAAKRIITAHDQLTRLEQFQVLAAFAEWGKEEAAK